MEYVTGCVVIRVLVAGMLDIRIEVLLRMTNVAGSVVLESERVDVRVGALAVEVGFVCDAVPVVYSVAEAVLVTSRVLTIVLDRVLTSVTVCEKVVK